MSERGSALRPRPCSGVNLMPLPITFWSSTTNTASRGRDGVDCGDSGAPNFFDAADWNVGDSECATGLPSSANVRVRAVGAGRFLLPDGSERYLVTEARLMELTARLGGELIDPIKTTIVQNQRSMTTWVVRKA
mgnify:CR=1 FL=1